MSDAWLVSYAVLWVLVVVLFALVFALYRHFGMMSMGTAEGVDRDGLAVGVAAPQFSAASDAGGDVLWRPTNPRPSLLLFAALDCAPCDAVMPYVAQVANAGAVRVTVILRGRPETAREFRQRHDGSIEPLAEDGADVFDHYDVRVTPFAFLINPEGKIAAKGLCSDPVRLSALLTRGGVDADHAASPGGTLVSVN